MQKCEVKLRLPAKLKAWLQQQAKENVRTMNGETVLMLTRLMEADQQSGKQA